MFKKNYIFGGRGHPLSFLVQTEYCYWKNRIVTSSSHRVPTKDKIGRDQGNPLGITHRPQSHTLYVAALLAPLGALIGLAF